MPNLLNPYRHGAAAPIGTYNDEVMADSPGVYWKLDEASGVSVNDSSGNNRGATYAGVPTLNQASLLSDGTGKSVIFDGSNDRVHIAYASWMDCTSWTGECLLVAPSSTGTFVVFSRWTDSNDASMLCQIVNGKLNGIASAGGNWTVTSTAVGATTLTPGTTYHVACVLTAGSTVQVFVNGVLDGSIATSVASNSGDTQGMDLANGANTVYSAIRLDEYAWYPTAISAARLLVHATAAFTP
jgi:hypothetical protein